MKRVSELLADLDLDPEVLLEPTVELDASAEAEIARTRKERDQAAKPSTPATPVIVKLSSEDEALIEESEVTDAKGHLDARLGHVRARLDSAIETERRLVREHVTGHIQEARPKKDRSFARTARRSVVVSCKTDCR
jgi:hypothetical protein